MNERYMTGRPRVRIEHQNGASIALLGTEMDALPGILQRLRHDGVHGELVVTIASTGAVVIRHPIDARPIAA